ncbi:MAG: hypothetical protein Q8Q11_03175 [bacterium]|nr:hypothetical protein [bacterium]
MREIGREHPGWYHLRTEEEALLLDVHESAVPDADSPAMRIAERRQEAMEIPDEFVFTSPDSDQLGYGGVLEEVEADAPSWRAFRGELPEISRGIGTTDPARAYPLTTTLELLFNHFCIAEHDSDSPLPQHLTVMLRNDKGSFGYGHMVHAEVLPPLARWIHANLEQGREREVSEAMRMAHELMSGNGDLYDWHDFRVATEPPKWVHLDVPGNACGLDPASSFSRDEETDSAYKLTPHNTDSPLQQLTLLYGLARLEEMAVEDRRQAMTERLALDLEEHLDTQSE